VIRWLIFVVAIAVAAGGCAPAGRDDRAVETAPVATKTRLSDDDLAFVSYMVTSLEVAEEVLAQFDYQSSLADDDPSLLGDVRWRQDTANVLDLLEKSGHRLQDYPAVPPLFASLNQECASLGQDLVAVATDYSKGIDEHSISRLQAAVEDQQSANAKMSRIGAELDSLRQH
jgi:hypothetical protein